MQDKDNYGSTLESYRTAGTSATAEIGQCRRSSDPRPHEVTPAAAAADTARLPWLEAPFRPRRRRTRGQATAVEDDDNDPSERGAPDAEATAWAMDAAAKGPLNMSGVFLGTSLLRLATEAAAAGAKSSTASADDGAGPPRVFGLLPSSLLTAASVVVTLAAALLMPIFGAVLDYTKHRRTVGTTTAVLILLINGAQTFVSARTWPWMLLLQIVFNFLFVVHTTVVLAYLPDLTPDEDELARYTSWFSVVHFLVVAAFVIVVLTGTSLVGAADATLYTARFSHALSFVVSSPLLLYAWTRLFRPRPALHDPPAGRSVWTAGFVELASTGRRVLGRRTLYPGLRWFMVSLLFAPDAGSGNYIGIFVTFLTEQVGMTGRQVGAVVFLILLSTIPGSLLSEYLCVKYNALNSFRLCLVWWMSVNALAAWALTGPERSYLTYVPFSVMWGVQFGWLFPSQRVLFCTLIPPGKETELMGIFAFFGQILGWLPPFLFSFVNEKGWGMRLGLVSSNSCLVLALLALWCIGDYDEAVRQAKDPKKLEESGGIGPLLQQTGIETR